LTSPVEMDTTPPTVVGKSPASDATNVPITTTIETTFSEPMNQTATEGAFALKEGEQNVTGAFSWANNTMRFTPDNPLKYNTLYTVSLNAEAKDLAGNPLNPITWTFTTEEEPGEDTIPPAAVTDLTIQKVKSNSVTLSWTATGDDGNIGQASAYDLRYSTSAITDDNFEDATKVENPPTPQVAGSPEVFTVTNLTPQMAYYFALKVLDEVPNISEISNVVNAITTVLLGDVSGDNNVTAYDAALILQHVVGVTNLSSLIDIADVSGNGSITALDAALVLQYTVNLIDHFPAEKPEAAPTDFKVIQSVTVSIPRLNTKPGAKITVPISVDGVVNLFSAKLTLEYDGQMLKLLNISAPELPSWEGPGVGELPSNALLTSHSAETGRLTVGLSSAKAVNGKTSLINLEFEVLPIAIDGKLGQVRIVEAFINEGIQPKIENGSIKVLPYKTALLQNYPNPFNPETWIPFELANEAFATIRIYNINGCLIRTIALGQKAAGMYLSKDKAAYWDGRDNFGEKVSSGVYFYTLQVERQRNPEGNGADKFITTRKLVVVK